MAGPRLTQSAPRPMRTYNSAPRPLGHGNGKRRPKHRPEGAIDIRIYNPRAEDYYRRMRVYGPQDAPGFYDFVVDQIRAHPRGELFMSINGYAPWLKVLLDECIKDFCTEIAESNEEVQFQDTTSFPERSKKRKKWVPWSFIVDEMNVPEVYWWTFDMLPPDTEKLSSVNSYRLRLGVWTCGRGALRLDDNLPVTISFTQNEVISENVICDSLFQSLHEDPEFKQDKSDEEGVCYIFHHLYDQLTDWQNIIREVEHRLTEAELNSRGRNLPVKQRTRTMHKEVDRLYELKEYSAFQSRSFKKLAKSKDDVSKSEQKTPVWSEIDDAMDDLDQYDSYLDSYKERFNNLIESEFNIENATQSDNSRFLSIIATLFSPVSYLASIFGITTFSTPAIVYLYIAIPLLLLSIAFTILFPIAVRRFQKVYYPLERVRVRPQRRDFTMLGQEMPNTSPEPHDVQSQAQRDRRKHTGGPEYGSGFGAAEGGRSRAGSRARPRSTSRPRSRAGSRLSARSTSRMREKYGVSSESSV